MTLTHKFIPLITELLLVFFMDLVIPIKQWTIVGNLNDLQILQDWTRESWKLISKCVWTEVGWSNQTNVDWCEKYLHPHRKVQFQFQNDRKSNSDIYTPGWLFHLAFTEIRKKFIGFKLSLSGMILYLPHLNIFHSLTVLGKRGEEKSSKLVPKILPEASFMSLKRSLPIKRMIPTYLDGRAFNAVHRYKFSEQEWYVWWCDKSAYSHIKHHICCGRRNLRTFVWSKN